jgi:hypothetical protein
MNLNASVCAPVEGFFEYINTHFLYINFCFQEMKCTILLVVKFNFKMYIPYVFLPNCKFYIP